MSNIEVKRFGIVFYNLSLGSFKLLALILRTASVKYITFGADLFCLY